MTIVLFDIRYIYHMTNKTHKRLQNCESSDLVKQPNYESSYFMRLANCNSSDYSKVKHKHKLNLLGGMRISENDGPVNEYLLCILLEIIGNRCEWGGWG